MEHTRHVVLSPRLRRIVRVEIRRLHKTRGRVAVAGDSAHAGARTKRRELGDSPRCRLWKRVVRSDIRTQVLHMPRKGRLIGEHADRVIVHMHAVSGLLDRDATLRISHNPVKIRNAKPLTCRFPDNHRICERSLDLIDRGEVRRNPKRKFESANVRGSGSGLSWKLRIPGKIKASNGKARIVAAIEKHRVTFIVDAHADNRVRSRRIVHKLVRNTRARRPDARHLAVAKRPVKIAPQVHMPIRVQIPYRRAHRPSPLREMNSYQSSRTQAMRKHRCWNISH